VTGEIGKVVSHSFRLFGNIFAGGIILALAGPITIQVFNSVGLPTYSTSPFLVAGYFVLQSFFGLFVGTVQALVFSLLALTYIAVLRD
jgi:F-type H+-transporting ATPase subunit a